MSDPLPDDIDWSITTFEGNRRRQHEEFRALSFREKLAALEDMDEIVAFFAGRKSDDGGTIGSKAECGDARGKALPSSGQRDPSAERSDFAMSCKSD